MRTAGEFCYAGGPLRASAEQELADAIDATRFDIEVMHLGDAKSRTAEADSAGVRSVPALVIAGSYSTPTPALRPPI